MILKTLTLTNFKQYDKLELPFREGLTGIVGKNGAGKSSIFEAVLVCLFGEIKGDKKLIRSSWAKEKEAVSLELTFEVQNKRYKILREYRGKILTHYAHLYDHKDTAIASGATPVNEEIENLIGMDKDAFTRSIFSGQKELGEISNTKGEERRKMVRKMVGLDKLDKIQNLVREDRNSSKNQIKGKSSLLFSEAEVKEKEKELKLNQKELEKQNKVLEKVTKQVADKQHKYETTRKTFEEQNQLYKQYNDFTQQRTKYETAVENFEAQLVDYEAQFKKLKTLEKALKKQAPQIKAFEEQKKELGLLEIQKDQFEKQNQLQQQQELVANQLSDLQQQLKELEAIPDRIQKGNQHVAALIEMIKKQEDQIQQFELDLKELSAQLGAINSKITERNNQVKQISDLGKEAECPTCFQPLINSYESTLERFQKDIQQYTEQELKKINHAIDDVEKKKQSIAADLKKQQAALQKGNNGLASLAEKEKQQQHFLQQQNKLQESLKRYQEQIKSLGKIDFDPNSYAALKVQIQDFEATYIQYRSQLDDVGKIPELINAKSQLQERIEKGKATLVDLKKQLKALSFSEKAYLKIQETQQTLEKERDEIQLFFNEQKEVVYNIKASIQSVETVLQKNQDIKTSIQQQQEDLIQLESLDAAFTKFKSKALDKVRPIIKQYASALFNEITKGRYESISVNEDFEFFISDNGTEYPITRFSGGEIDLANLCLRIGISKAISELSGSSAAMNLLCFDEIFGSQDEDRRFEILKAFDLLKEQYRQIYIVSHIESIKDYFPNILQIQKTRAGSKVEWL